MGVTCSVCGNEILFQNTYICQGCKNFVCNNNNDCRLSACKNCKKKHCILCKNVGGFNQDLTSCSKCSKKFK